MRSNSIVFSPVKEKLLRNFPPSGTYLVGISGGRDSVALLDWLIRTGYRNLIVCHLNHQLRGRSSDADARFVQKLLGNYKTQIAGQARRVPKLTKGKRSACPTTAAAPKLELFVESADVRSIAAKRKLSI